MKCLTLCMNRKNRASSQFKNYNFSGLAKFKGKYIAINKEGFFQLGGDKDNTAAISSYVVPVETDFGMNNNKALRFMYFGLDAAADLLLEVTPDDSDNPQEYAVELTKEGQQRVRLPMRRNQTGRYWKFKLSNENGNDFALDSIQVLVVPLHYGHR